MKSDILFKLRFIISKLSSFLKSDQILQVKLLKVYEIVKPILSFFIYLHLPVGKM